MMNLMRWQSIHVETPVSPWRWITRTHEGVRVRTTELVVGLHGRNRGQDVPHTDGKNDVIFTRDMYNI